VAGQACCRVLHMHHLATAAHSAQQAGVDEFLKKDPRRAAVCCTCTTWQVTVTRSQQKDTGVVVSSAACVESAKGRIGVRWRGRRAAVCCTCTTCNRAAHSSAQQAGAQLLLKQQSQACCRVLRMYHLWTPAHSSAGRRCAEQTCQNPE
jgi:hypothetical protein